MIDGGKAVCAGISRVKMTESRQVTKNLRQRLRYAVDDPGFVVNIRTFTTHMGLVIMAVTAPTNKRELANDLTGAIRKRLRTCLRGT